MNKSVVASVITVTAFGLGSTGAMAQSQQNGSFESMVLGDGVGQRVNSHSLSGWDIGKQADASHSQVKLLNPSDSFMAGTPLLNDSLRSSMGSRLLVDGLQFAAKVPEPSGSAMVLAGLGALGLMFRRRRLQG
ncbi:MAG TPA: PEP-CTERM sorting domain-containing protein [Ideonella sp.]|uniref:PEP-CTERM sorting domain-containing protein n=1 Tax=Ideonella sp. TaxID=1929293 RepID=UPI002B9DF267|nr:PEP-CTERM sorting domain-containing protein [Ideonella sp.]HSI50549.1 PEP-CTERM sorting domain-containing protein [Ideonella sp.]